MTLRRQDLRHFFQGKKMVQSQFLGQKNKPRKKKKRIFLITGALKILASNLSGPVFFCQKCVDFGMDPMFCNFDRETHQQKKNGDSFRVIWGPQLFCGEILGSDLASESIQVLLKG